MKQQTSKQAFSKKPKTIWRKREIYGHEQSAEEERKGGKCSDSRENPKMMWRKREIYGHEQSAEEVEKKGEGHK